MNIILQNNMTNKNPNIKIIKAISSIIKKWTEKSNKKFIIGIDGTSGIGKTTIAKKVAKKNKRITLVNLDLFLTPESERMNYLKCAKNKVLAYKKKWYNIKKIRSLINLFKKPSRKRVYILNTNHKNKLVKIRYNLTNNIMLIEGIFLNDNNLFKSTFDKIIYLDIDKKNMIKRRKKRFRAFYPQGNLKKRKVYEKIFDSTWKQYKKRYNPYKESDLVIKMKVVKKFSS